MIPLLTSEQMRALDAHAINEVGIPGMILMENAALACLNAIEEDFDDVEGLFIAVVCGPGNNGGDGFALARQLFLRGAEVDVLMLSDPAKLKGDALANYKLLEPLDLEPLLITDENELPLFDDYDLIVDALFGTGAVRAPEGLTAKIIDEINYSGAPVLSVDVPSGVDASTGEAPGTAVCADVTVTFQCAKAGLLLPPGRDLAGDVIVAPISIPEEEDVIVKSPFFLPEDDDLLDLLPFRARDAHKGDFGKLLIIAGSRGMSGAARLAADAALRSGVGLVKVAAPESIRAEIAGYAPEIMTIGLPETSAGCISAEALEVLSDVLEWADVVAVGPGFGLAPETAEFLEKLLKTVRIPLVVDADGLNLIAAHRLQDLLPEGTVVTPHPIEFDRLNDKSSATFQDRLEEARNFARSRNVSVVLKGAPTVCFSRNGHAMVNPTGNPGLATGGSGDVLTGIIASLRAQGLEPFTASWCGVFLHGRAADLGAMDIGEASLIPGDVIDYLPDAFELLGVDEDDEDEDMLESHSSGGS